MRLIGIILGFFLSAWGIDGYSGKSLLLTLPSPAGIVSAPDKNISVVAHPLDKSKGIAIIPIDYYTAAKGYNLIWSAPGITFPLQLDVAQGSYPTETLTVDPAKVAPPPEALERIAQERDEAHALYNTFTPIRYWNKPFIAPMTADITSVYGAARTYNGTLKSYHGGVDFRARTPLPILATNDGIVVLAKDRYYAGGTVIIDHGEGLYSCYFHLSRFDVALGERIARGQVIGLTGATGRITGPHLHFGIVAHGVQTDPLYLITLINTLFPKELHEPIASR